MARQTIDFFENRSFGVVHDVDENPKAVNAFTLHNHENIYEILLLVSGDCEFRVEGNGYDIHPGDVVFVRPDESHRMTFRSEKRYERVILYIKSEFFRENECEGFLAVFENRELGSGNIVRYDIAKPMLKECMERLDRYGADGEYEVVQRVIYEMLYLLNNHTNTQADSYVKNERVRNIILYINEHLTQELSLDELAGEFFIAKEYMCKIFKANTGHTVNQYITHKRILLVQEMYRNGQTLLQASMNAGFKSYTNFYKAYVKHMGKKPKEM